MHCIICDNVHNNSQFQVRELQLGLGEEFKYEQCASCGSLQLVDPPPDLSKYYPNENYYSFRVTNKLTRPGLFRRIKSNYLLYGKNRLLGKLLSIGYRVPEYYPWMIHTNAQPDDAILDVGSGTGDLLKKLYKTGFRNLTGIDPFIQKEISYGQIQILKKDIFQVEQKFDVIMMHHALEHMSDPLKAMQKAYSLLNPESYLLVRIPVAGNYGWKKYKEFWSGIDAPRHMFIPSEKGMMLLGSKAGFALERYEYDSTDYMIWSSEQYKKGISLYDPRSRMVNPKGGIFSKGELKEFRRIIGQENKKNHADTAAFYFRKSTA